jgi:tRNA(fMet)-specific endonuclease VapC
VRTLCLDTNTYSAFRKAIPEAVTLVNAVDQVWMPAVVLGELRAGFLNGNKHVANELLLHQFLDQPSVVVGSISEVTSRHYAKIHSLLRQSGTPIPSNDIWIAACALELDCPLYSFDAHFKHVKGLKIVTSTEDWKVLNG